MSCGPGEQKKNNVLRKNPILIILAAAVSILLGFAVSTLWNTQPDGTDGSASARPGSSGAGGGPPGGRAVLVITAPARIAEIVDEIEAIGTTHANESVLLTAKVTDTVRRVNFDDGDYVEAGTVLVELTNDEQTAALAEARANLDEAQKQFARMQGLVARGNAPQSRLDEVQAQLDTARARVDVIVARLANFLIRAPFAGILGFRGVSPGTMVTPQTVVTTLDDVSIIKLDFSVPETFLSALGAGMEVDALSAAYPDRRFAGIVSTVGSRVDPVTRAVTVRALMPNDEGLLRPGMLMAVVLVRSRDQVLVIPEEALVPVQDKQFVFTIEGGKAQRVEVEIGRRRPGIVEILAGLSVNQQVVTDGTLRLRPGVAVQVLNSGPAEATPAASQITRPGTGGASGGRDARPAEASPIGGRS